MTLVCSIGRDSIGCNNERLPPKSFLTVYALENEIEFKSWPPLLSTVCKSLLRQSGLVGKVILRMYLRETGCEGVECMCIQLVL
jgi:hypothetical protein